MRGSGRILAAALAAVALAAAGCGGDEEGKPIPAGTAETLNLQLQKVQERITQGSVGACKDILDAPDERGPNKKQVQDAIDSMPDDVDPDVKSALQDSFDHLWELVEQDCEDKESEQEQEQNTTPTQTQTQEETTPTETQEETTPAETETETTPTTTVPPSEEQLPGGEGNGNGGGAGPGALKQEKKGQKK